MNRRAFQTVALAALAALPMAAAKDENRAADVRQRLTDADTVFREIMKTPEKSIPDDLLERAHCAIIVPGMKKGGFIVGAKYGKGFMTCRSAAHTGWSAPANVRIEGGSVGFQIGGGEVDVILLVMNEAGAKRLLKSEFKIGGEASAMAGPVGRSASAETDAYMRAEMLSWSRSRGLFAGISLDGSTLREDRDDNRALYGRDMTNQQIINGAAAPPEAAPLLKDLGRYSFREKK